MRGKSDKVHYKFEIKYVQEFYIKIEKKRMGALLWGGVNTF